MRRCLERVDVVRVREQARHVLVHQVDRLAGGLLDLGEAAEARLSLRIGVPLQQRRQSVREAAGTRREAVSRRVRGRGAGTALGEARIRGPGSTALAAEADRCPRPNLQPQQRQLVAQALRQLLGESHRRRGVVPEQGEPPDGEAERHGNEAGLRRQLLHSTSHRTREHVGPYWDAIGTNGPSGHARLDEDQMPPGMLRATRLDARLPAVGHSDARMEHTAAHQFARTQLPRLPRRRLPQSA
eukprot:scaffold16593_cov51-Phaeocystis_antarctica.AAC.4